MKSNIQSFNKDIGMPNENKYQKGWNRLGQAPSPFHITSVKTTKDRNLINSNYKASSLYPVTVNIIQLLQFKQPLACDIKQVTP